MARRTKADLRLIEERKIICRHCSRACVKYICELCGAGKSSAEELFVCYRHEEKLSVCNSCACKVRSSAPPKGKPITLLMIVLEEVKLRLCEDYDTMPYIFPIKKEEGK